MSIQTINRVIEFKLYLNSTQEKMLDSWLSTCCWIYNQALEHRIKAYKRRKQPIKYLDQQSLLTRWRSRIEKLNLIPAHFERGALRRVDHGFKAFFRRLKAGQKPGFPRFKPCDRYKSLEHIAPGNFIRNKAIFVPGLGEIRARGRFEIEGRQVGIRILKRASGWHASIIMEFPKPTPLLSTNQECGIDLGLDFFATFDNGERIENLRIFRKSANKLRKAKRKFSRCKRNSKRRLKAKIKAAKIHERIKRQRRGFCHRVSRMIVNRFDRIAIEALNLKGLATGMLAKSVNDAAWGIFILCLTYKAEDAGRILTKVNSCGTSQECPACGRIARKELSEREHNCSCGLRCDRDQAAALVIRQRAFRSVCVEAPANTSEMKQVELVNRKVQTIAKMQ